MPVSIFHHREGEMSVLSLLNYLEKVLLKDGGGKATMQPLMLEGSSRRKLATDFFPLYFH